MTFFIFVSSLSACSDKGDSNNKNNINVINKESLPAESLLGSINLDKNRGHAVFTIEGHHDKEISITSLQQSETKPKKLNKSKITLANLQPQNHTFLASLKIENESHFALFKDIAIEAGKFIELGIPAFQKPGSIGGRILSSSGSVPIPNVNIRLNELNLSVQTDQNGEFSLSLIPPGQWQLSAYARGAGMLRGTSVEIVSGQKTDLGDLWIAEAGMKMQEPQILGSKNNIVVSPSVKLQLSLPSGARFISIKSKEGETFLDKSPAKNIVEFVLSKSINTSLEIKIYRDDNRILGTMAIPFVYDPFASNGIAYVPELKIENRVIVSPARAVVAQIQNIPENASRVRFGIDGIMGQWRALSAPASIELPKKNTSCGQRTISAQIEHSQGHLSRVFEMPVTLSCWERIPHRAAIEKIIGIDNAATWTGTHAFVWSGKQFDPTRRHSVWGGSNSAETVQIQSALHTYKYSDAGYIFKPNINPTTKQLERSQIEFIVTDNAPKPRASAGIGGKNNLVAVYGGENENGPLADGGIFDIAANGWVSMMAPGAPSPRIKPSVYFIDDHKVLVWGGKTVTNLGYEVPLNDGAIYDIQTHRWNQVSAESAPLARMNYVGVWTGNQFYILGGVLPGSIEQLSAAKYDPSSNSWQSLPNLAMPVTHMSALYKDNRIILYGRDHWLAWYNLSTNTLGSAHLDLLVPELSKDKWMLSPNIVLGEHTSEATKNILYVFGGSSSLIESDVNTDVLLFEYSASEIKYSGSVLGFPAATTESKATAQCCFDMLSFNYQGKVFALNGTEVSNTSVYTKITESTAADNSTNNFSSTFYLSKTYNSRILKFDSATNAFTRELIDHPADRNFSAAAPLGPYYLHRTNPPAWSPDQKSLIWYGGIYGNPVESLYLQGGYVYNLESRSWSTVPIAPSEPSYTHSVFGNQFLSRFDSVNFVAGNTFYMLGGYNYPTTTLNFLYNGLKANFSDNTLGAPQPIPEVTPLLDFSPLAATNSNHRWDSNPPCVAGNFVLFSGGRRKSVRGTDSGFNEKGLVQRKVVFDTATDQMTPASDGPLEVRSGSTVISTGSECIIWGGYTADGAVYKSNSTEAISELATYFAPIGNGASYSFASDTWKLLPASGAPPARAFMHGVWTGSDALLWGGSSHHSPSVSSRAMVDAGVWRYSPSLNVWDYLRPAPGEPRYNGDERPVWTGSHMLIWKPTDAEYSFEFDPKLNEWTRLPMPHGFNYRTIAFHDSHVVWATDKLFVMPYINALPAEMALFVPPDP